MVGKILPAVVLFLLPIHAGADSKQLLDQALRLYKDGQFARALGALKKADGARSAEERAGAANPVRAGWIHLYAGLCNAVMRQPMKARQSFAKALESNPTLSLDTNRYKPELVTLFEQVRLALSGKLTVTSDTAQALVVVDSVEVGSAPATIALKPGRHEVSVRRPQSTVVVTREIELRARQTKRINVSLRPVKRPRDRPADGDRSARVWPWKWIAAGGAGVLLAVGLGIYISADADYGELEDNFEAWRAAGNNAALADIKSRIRRKDATAAVMFSLSGALVVTSLALLYFDRTPRREKISPWSASLVPMTGETWGLQLDLHF